MSTRTESWLMRRWGKWVVPYAALWITMLIGGVVVVALALTSAEVYDNVVDDAGLANLDKPTLAFMEQLRSPGLDSFVTGFTNIGGGIGIDRVRPDAQIAPVQPGGNRARHGQRRQRAFLRHRRMDAGQEGIVAGGRG